MLKFTPSLLFAIFLFNYCTIKCQSVIIDTSLINNGWKIATHLESFVDDSQIILGTQASNSTKFLARINSTGNPIWIINNESTQRITDMLTTVEGEIVVFSEANGFDNNPIDPTITKYNSEGELLWSSILDTKTRASYGRLFVNSQKNIVLIRVSTNLIRTVLDGMGNTVDEVMTKNIETEGPFYTASVRDIFLDSEDNYYISHIVGESVFGDDPLCERFTRVNSIGEKTHDLGCFYSFRFFEFNKNVYLYDNDIFIFSEDEPFGNLAYDIMIPGEFLDALPSDSILQIMLMDGNFVEPGKVTTLEFDTSFNLISEFSYTRNTSSSYTAVARINSDCYSLIGHTPFGPPIESYAEELIYVVICAEQTSNVDSSDASPYSVYPNPCENTLNIGGGSDVKSVNVYNVSGRSIEAHLTNSGSINTANMENGIYLLQITSRNGNVVLKKFIKS